MLVPLVILAWCFVTGLCVGSFLNVVAWRLPQGMSLAWPGSHCPACKKAILFRDNVPVLGWLWLRGRCRWCGARIAGRYAIVEFVTGAIFAALAWPELIAGGANLPQVEGGPALSLELLVGVWIYHAALCSLLVVLALFALDNARVPRKFLIAAILMGLVPTLVVPGLLPIPISADADPANDPQLASLFAGLVGLICGAVLGLLLAWPRRDEHDRSVNDAPTVAGLALIGLFLGWQAALSVACMMAVALLLRALLGLITRNELSRPAVLVLAAALVQIIFWRELSEVPWWPGPEAADLDAAVACAAVIAAGAALLALRRVVKRRK